MRYLVLLFSFLLILSAAATGCSRQPSYLGAPKDLPKSDAASNYMDVDIFYPDGDALSRETHEIPKAPDKIKAALDVLFQAKPNNGNIIPIMPENVKVLSTKVENGLLTINFNKNILFFDADKNAQDLLLAAIVSTARQSASIRQVKFLVEGKDKGQIDGKDIEKFWGDVSLKDQPWKL